MQENKMVSLHPATVEMYRQDVQRLSTQLTDKRDVENSRELVDAVRSLIEEVIVLGFFRGVSLICLCIVGIAVILAPLELVAYPMLKSIGCSLTEEQQGFACGDGWVGHLIATVLNLPILFSDAREFTFGASFGRGLFTVYLFDAIFTLALTYPLLILFAPKRGRRSN